MPDIDKNDLWDITFTIQETAKSYNIDPELLKAMAYIESRFDTNAVNKSADTKGLFQLKPFVAEEMGIKGMEHVPSLSIDATAKLIVKNQKALEERGIPATNPNLYLTHQQGIRGFTELYNSAKKNITPRTVKQRISNNAGKGLTALDFLRKWTQKYHESALEADQFLSEELQQ